MLLIIDNYDSFTFNLVQRIGELDLQSGMVREMQVIRNDQITLSEVQDMQPSRLLISPGPCTPDQSGISRELIGHFRGSIPILGVCLGHQAIADLYGMKVVRYEKPVHGKTSPIYHDGKGAFANRFHMIHCSTNHFFIYVLDS